MNWWNTPMVGLRDGKRAVHWPGVRVHLALGAVCVIAVSFGLDRFLRDVLGHEPRQAIFERALSIGAVSVGCVILKLRRVPHRQLPSLDS